MFVPAGGFGLVTGFTASIQKTFLIGRQIADTRFNNPGPDILLVESVR
jgi:hypothetical protein